jgi:hypothetical protein
VILAADRQIAAGEIQKKTKAEALDEMISALNTDSEMVLVAAGADASALEPVVWARAAYVVQISEKASGAEALRVMLQEVLNRGRDAALVASLENSSLTAETVHRMVTAYCAAGDEIWAVVPGTARQQGFPVLLGRRMIELFLRGQKTWSTAEEFLVANIEHLCTMEAVDPLAKTVPGAGWKAPWD